MSQISRSCRSKRSPLLEYLGQLVDPNGQPNAGRDEENTISMKTSARIIKRNGEWEDRANIVPGAMVLLGSKRRSVSRDNLASTLVRRSVTSSSVHTCHETPQSGDATVQGSPGRPPELSSYY
jgi:hypothetical protein